MLGVNLDDVKIGEKSNCNSGCGHCGKHNVYYSILNGNFVYYCLDCKKWDEKALKQHKWFKEYHK